MKAELQFTPVVQAILALVVLLVCVAVFMILTQTPVSTIFKVIQNITLW